MRSEVNIKKQEKVDITTGSLKKILDRMRNWKSPSPDLVQGFWLKNFNILHERVSLRLKECLVCRFVPSWLTRGRISLLQKDRKSRNKNLTMAWIDYKKAYDMLPHSWIIECLDLLRVAENIKSLLVNSM